MDERDRPKALLSLPHILEGSLDVGDDGWTRREWRNGVGEEAEGERGKFQIHNSTKFNHRSTRDRRAPSRCHGHAVCLCSVSPTYYYRVAMGCTTLKMAHFSSPEVQSAPTSQPSLA